MTGPDEQSPESNGCPASDSLRRFGAGELPEPEHEAVGRHLEQCPECLASLGSGDDELILLLRNAPPLDAVPEAVVQLVMAAIEPTTEVAPGGTARPGPVETRGDRFRIRRRHTIGGTGVLYVAEDLELNREVALKEMQDRHAGNRQSRMRFLREAQITGTLEHPGIVPVYSVGHHSDGRPYYAMRLIRGVSLRTAITRFHRATPVRWRSLDRHCRDLVHLLGRFASACNAVAYAHSQGVIHRDLKPDNIMLGPYGETLVIDWGLAKPPRPAVPGDSPAVPPEAVESDFREGAAAEDTTADERTRPWAVAGTPQYMSPEQAAGQLEGLGPASDVYSLGATLYCLLTDRPPFPAASMAEGELDAVLAMIQRGDFPKPRAVRPDVPPPLEAICLKAMAREPGDRYPGPLALVEDLEHWLNDEPVSACPDGHAGRLARWLRRHHAWVQAGAAAALVVAVIAAGAVVSIGGSRRAVVTALAHEKAAHKQAEAFKNQAITSAREARKQRDEATRAAHDSRVLSAHLALDRGLDLLEQGNAAGGLDWFLRGLRLAPADAQGLRRAFRANFSAWWAEMPVLKHHLPHSQTIWAVAFSPDGKLLLTAGEDATARLWSTETGLPIDGHLAGHTRTILAATFSPDGRTALTGSLDGTARLWEVPSGRLIRPIQVGKSITTVAFRPDGRALLTSDSGGRVRFWNPNTGEPDGPPLEHPSEIRSAAFSADGRFIAVACDGDPRLYFWDQVKRTRVRPYLEHPAAIRAVAISPVGRIVAVGGTDNRTFLHEQTTGGRVGGPLAHQNWVTSLAFSGDGRHLVSGSYDNTARIWETDSGRPVGLPIQYPENITCVAFSPDGRTVATGALHGSVRIWELPSGPGLGTPLRQGDIPHTVLALSADGTTALTRPGGQGDAPSALQLWDVASGEPIGSPLPIGNDLRAVALSADGKLVLACSMEQEWMPRVWAVSEGRATRRSELDGVTLSAIFGPDGKAVLTGAYGSARLWDVATGKPLGEPLRHWGEVRALAFSPDGQTLLTGSSDNLARLWDRTTGRPIRELAGHNGDVISAAFDPTGKIIVTGSRDGTARLWDAETGEQRGEPMRHHGSVLAVAFSANGQDLLTGSHDQNARLWDVSSGKPIGRSLPHHGPVWAVAIRPEATTFLTGDERTVHSWRIPIPAGGAPGQLPLRTAALTGLELDSHGVLHALDSTAWQQLRHRLESAAEAPGP